MARVHDVERRITNGHDNVVLLPRHADATPPTRQVDEGKLDATIKEINVKPEQLVIIDLSSDAEDEHVTLTKFHIFVPWTMLRR